MKWHSKVLIPFLTLDCDAQCTYCITRFAPDHNLSFTHLYPQAWSSFFNSIEGVEDIIFNGGEPTLYPGFPDIVNSLPALKLIAIGTNYSHRATLVLLDLHPRSELIIDGTFHPGFISHDAISQTLLILKSAGYRVRVHLLSHPSFKRRPADWVHDFTIQGIDAFIQGYEGFWQDLFYPVPSKRAPCGMQSRSQVRCSRSIYTPIAPDGRVFFCHYLMYSQTDVGVLGNITDTEILFPDYLDCPHYGWCSPCDWPRSVEAL